MELTPEQLEGARWSSAAICPRRAVYEASDVEPSDDLSDRMADLMWRGSVMGNAYQARYIAENPGWQAEVEVPWGTWPDGTKPIGTGHLDLGHEQLAKGIEVKTVLQRIPRHAFVQLTGYIIFLGWERGEIHAIDPATGKVDIVPVNLETYRPFVEAALTAIEESLRMKTVPERVCASPAAWQARACAFRSKCFLGWVGDDIPETGDVAFDGEPRYEEMLHALRGLAQEIKDARNHLVSLEGTRDHLRSQVRGTLPSGRWVTFGDGEWMVRVTPVAGSRTLPLGRLTEAGWDIPVELQEFVTEGKGHERWTFKQKSP